MSSSPRTICAKESGRLDRVLRNSLEKELAQKISRKSWDFLFEHGLVKRSDAKRYRAGDSINKGDLITLLFPSESLGLTANPEIQVETVAGDVEKSWIIFNKPKGIATYSHYPWDHSSFANGINSYLEKQNFNSFEALAEPPHLEGGLVQRLDRNTSGVLLCALNKLNKDLFRKLISEKKVEKKYLALVSGVCESGVRNFFLRASGAKKMKASSVRCADTDIEVSLEVKQLSSNNFSLLEITTRDGARHVVRACMASLRFPLIGDELYGGVNICDINYHQLHALSLKVYAKLDPIFSDLQKGVSVAPPKEFLENIRKLELNYNYAK